MTPTRYALFAWGLLLLLGLIIPLAPGIASLWSVCAGFFAGIALFDFFLIRRKPELDLSRMVHHSLPVTAWSKVTVTIANTDTRTLTVEICDHSPVHFKIEKMPVPLRLQAGRSAGFSYRVYPMRRGLFTFTGIDVAGRSPLLLWRKKWFFPCAEDVRVFPNFKEIGRYTLLAVSHQLNQMGIRQIKQRGQGSEFHQLREYRDGDEMSKIDWKASSRYQRLISREFQNERDQQLVFMLDCGRRMRHEETGGNLLDQALGAMLLLAHVAIRQGDAAGVYTFGGQKKWIPPLKRDDAVRQLLLHTFDLHSTTEAADYMEAAARVMALQRRRSLIIFLTNSRAEDQDDLLQGATLLARKHLVVVADLRESILDQTREERVNSLNSALRYQALQEYLDQRSNLRRNFGHHGIQSLDVTADKLPTSLVNRYLDIKSSGQL